MPYFPSPKTFLRHVVMMNYAGKVYTVIRGIEIVSKIEWTLDEFNQEVMIWIVYIACMTLGMYWYTRFWLLKKDLDRFYERGLCSVSPTVILICASLYYILFSVLFYRHVTDGLAFSLWNGWCAANCRRDLLVIPCYSV